MSPAVIALLFKLLAWGALTVLSILIGVFCWFVSRKGDDSFDRWCATFFFGIIPFWVSVAGIMHTLLDKDGLCKALAQWLTP